MPDQQDAPRCSLTPQCICHAEQAKCCRRCVNPEPIRKVPRMPGDPDWKPCPDISGSLC